MLDLIELVSDLSRPITQDSFQSLSELRPEVKTSCVFFSGENASCLLKLQLLAPYILNLHSTGGLV